MPCHETSTASLGIRTTPWCRMYSTSQTDSWPQLAS